LACRYCNFEAPKKSSPLMPAAVARGAIDAYLQLLKAARKQTLEVQFFGGEPFYAWDTVFFAVEYARLRAAELGMKTRFEVITNGVFSTGRCRPRRLGR
jgi:sulfatase maturation enzyme AslB (radical SAM superfamily)